MSWLSSGKLWKAVGLAGVAGVAATGVIIARDQRQRAQLGPEEIRERLHRRLAAADAEADGHPVADTPPADVGGDH